MISFCILGYSWSAESGQVSGPRAAIYELLGDSRPIEGRLSGAFPYRPFDETARGFDLSNDKNLRQLARLEVDLRLSTESTDSPAGAHALAIVELLSGHVDGAIARLTGLLAIDEDNAEVRNDLAVAHAYRARVADDPKELLIALTTLERSRRASPQTGEMLFNRALLLERLGILSSSKQVWDQFIRYEGNTEWASEARRRLADLPEMVSPPNRFADRIESLLEQSDDRLVSAAVRQAPQEARHYVEEDLLPAWARERRASQNNQASRALTVARLISEALASSTGDRLLLETVDGIEAALAEPWSSRLDHLVTAFEEYQKAADALDGLEIGEARSRFLTARAAFRSADSPFELWARLYLAVCDNHEGRYHEAHASLGKLIHEADRRDFHALWARAHWINGFAFAVEAEPANALVDFRKALEGFDNLGEEEYASFICLLMAESYDLLGQWDEAWRYRLRTLRALGKSILGRRASVVLTAVSKAISDQGFSEVALYMQNDALKLARQEDSAIDEAETLWRRSSIYQRLGRTSDAAADLDAATELLSLVEDPSIRGLIESNLNRIRAQLSLASNPEHAVESLTETLKAFRRSHYRALLLDVLRSRAAAFVAENDLDSAEADLIEGVEEAERQRESISDRQLRASLLDKEEGLYDDLLALASSRGEREKALGYAEESRARGMLDRLAVRTASGGTSRAGLLDAESIRQRMPPNHALVEYKVVGNRQLLVWVVRSEGISHREVSFDRAQVEALIARLRAGIRQKIGDEVTQSAQKLFSILIGPIEPLLEGAHTIVFSPDDVLNGVPFAVLRNPSTSRYLIRDHAIGLTPSASAYLSAGGPSAAETSKGSQVLVVANPSFDRELFPRLPPLPASENLPSRLRGLGLRVTLLGGREATRDAFLTHLAKSDVVHFAGHALTNYRDSSFSQLLLAPDAGAGDSGVLYARDIVNTDLGRVRLVVLSACDSAGGRVSGTEGALSLASAFLAAGARDVVAGLWEVEDQAAAALFESFYQRLADGQDPIEALRLSQLGSADASGIDGMSTWSAFVHIGRLTEDPGQSRGSEKEE